MLNISAAMCQLISWLSIVTAEGDSFDVSCVLNYNMSWIYVSSNKSVYPYHHDGIIVWTLQYGINVKNMKSYLIHFTYLGWKHSLRPHGAANQFQMCLGESLFILVLAKREENKTRSEEGLPKNLQWMTYLLLLSEKVISDMLIHDYMESLC